MKSAAYNIKHRFSSVMMILALVWLTISLPYVYAAQQKLVKENTSLAKENSAKDANNGNPFANTTEEKAPGNTTISEEYLHHYEEPVYLSPDKLDHSHHLSYDTYVAFHGELLSPPPEFA